jgi:predicted nucleotidyltransferase
MNTRDVRLSDKHEKILKRVLAVCQRDERIRAAFLVGSHVNGTPDEHSDLDLYLLIDDQAHRDFVAARESFVQLLGKPAFVEDLGSPKIVFLIFPNGTEVEIHYVPAGQAGQVFDASYQVLLDKNNIAAKITPHEREANVSVQVEKLRCLIQWFWHDFSHFTTALARNQLWWAHGQLEVLRSNCVGLARLRNDFADPEVDDDVYFKIEKIMPVEQLSALESTFCPLDRVAMLEAGFTLVAFYREVATSLAKEYAIAYPDALGTVMVDRLKKVRG